MARSARRDRFTGAVDGVAGRILEALGKLTGRRSYKAKGKAARVRGTMRRKRGAAKKAGR
jgi:uncharacterized protein YjbJ (UPF0337 family)